MEIKQSVTYQVDGKEFDCTEKAEAYLLDKTQAELDSKLRKVFEIYHSSASLNYHVILGLVGTPKDLKETLSILSIYSEFPKEEEEIRNE